MLRSPCGGSGVPIPQRTLNTHLDIAHKFKLPYKIYIINPHMALPIFTLVSLN
jgi:hypothetical protein